jgi:hypothetical protein
MMKSRMLQCDVATRVWTRRLRQAGLGGALSLAALTSLAPATARAQAQEIFKALGYNIGIENQIDYRERSPLVVPPTRALPPPQPAGTVRNPNWPADADIARRKELEKRKNIDQTFDFERFTRSLPPSELGPAGAGAAAPQAPAAGGAASGGDMTAAMRPSELGSSGFFGFFKGSSSEQRTAAPVVEPPRRSLLEPPPGYQTPAPGQPYGVTAPSDYAKPKKPEDIPVGDAGL